MVTKEWALVQKLHTDSYKRMAKAFQLERVAIACRAPFWYRTGYETILSGSS
jgi:hypothetical protein